MDTTIYFKKLSDIVTLSIPIIVTFKYEVSFILISIGDVVYEIFHLL